MVLGHGEPERYVLERRKMAGGEQELNDEGRTDKALGAAVFLFELTRKDAYREYFDSHSAGTPLRTNTYVDLYAVERQEFLLEYTRSEGADTSIARAIAQRYREGVESDANLGAHRRNADPYLAYVHTYTWGVTPAGKAGRRLHGYCNLRHRPREERRGIAVCRAIHSLPSRSQPLGLVYLSNMADFGASRSVTRFFSYVVCPWIELGFGRNIEVWPTSGLPSRRAEPQLRVGLVLPRSLQMEKLWPRAAVPPAGQPPQKSYRDFNDAWPLNSWSVTEPDDAYQTAYIRLLSKFVAASR